MIAFNTQNSCFGTVVAIEYIAQVLTGKLVLYELILVLFSRMILMNKNHLFFNISLRPKAAIIALLVIYGTATATANEVISVTPVNDAPVAVDDNYTTPEDVAVILTPLDLDTDLEGDPLSIVSINGTALTPGIPQTITVPNGTVTTDAGGVITFTPDANYNGSVTFPYVITDGTATATANEVISVTL
ncbi:MAG: hypothetical protein ACJATY_001050, partial [Spirosomataceae bacterium]